MGKDYINELHEKNLYEFYDRTLEAYENIALEYALKNQSPSLSRPFINEFVKSLLPGNLILDAGCGHGRDTKLFHKLGYNTIGIDYSNEMVRIAKNNVPESVKIMQMNLLKMNFTPSYFDGIWSNAVLHHFSDEDIKTIIDNFYIILKPKGGIFISVRKNSQATLDSEYPDYSRYYNSVDSEKITGTVEESNFRIDKVEIQNLELKTWIQIYGSKNS